MIRQGQSPKSGRSQSAYLWEDVLRRESLANILEHFSASILVGKKKDPLAKKRLYFPRYHQLDVVRKLLAHAAHKGTTSISSNIQPVRASPTPSPGQPTD